MKEKSLQIIVSSSSSFRQWDRSAFFPFESVDVLYNFQPHAGSAFFPVYTCNNNNNNNDLDHWLFQTVLFLFLLHYLFSQSDHGFLSPHTHDLSFHCTHKTDILHQVNPRMHLLQFQLWLFPFLLSAAWFNTTVRHHTIRKLVLLVMIDRSLLAERKIEKEKKD